jgi:hypothetical protein
VRRLLSNLISPDGKYEWNGTAWVPVPDAPSPVSNLVSPDGKYEWNGTAWVAVNGPPRPLPPPPPAPLPAPGKQSHLVRNIVLGVVALIVVGTCINAIGSGSKSNNSASMATSSPAASPHTVAAASAPAASPLISAPAPAPAITPSPKAVPSPKPPTILLDIQGTGTASTASFAAHGNWDLAWWYDCANFGFQGNFIVEVYTADNSISFDNQGVNQLGTSGHSVEHYHSDQGSPFYLKVNSECDWHLTATGT